MAKSGMEMEWHSVRFFGTYCSYKLQQLLNSSDTVVHHVAQERIQHQSQLHNKFAPAQLATKMSYKQIREDVKN